jgi:hypothetical protein
VNVQKKIFPARRRGRSFLITEFRNYGFGDELVVVVVLVPGDEPVFTVVLDEDEDPEGDFSKIVVLFSVFFSAGGLVTVVSFCSQAARKARLIRIQMYFMVLHYSQPTH